MTLIVGVETNKAQSIDTYYGQSKVPLDDKNKTVKQPMPDAFGSEMYIDGKTDVALDARSIAAQTLTDQQEQKIKQMEVDRSIREDISSGQPITVLIAPEHFVQLTFLKNNEIVYPRRAFTGQPDLVFIDKKENSPYIYIEASAMVEGQTTNLFIETEEDGKIQTYVINLLVTEPQNIREQVSVNLTDDKTPPIRGGVGSEEDFKNEQQAQNRGQGQQSPPTQQRGSTAQPDGNIGVTFSGKFTEDDVKKYLSTMIEMADHYDEAKQIEKKTGRIIYRDRDIKIYPSGANNYIDPVEGTLWNVAQVWYFPKYDAILLDVRVKNPTANISKWDFSQTRWAANNSPTPFPSAAAPMAIQTLPNRTNQIWFLVQGNRVDPNAEFSPVFPKAERRGGGSYTAPVNTTKSTSKSQNKITNKSNSDFKTIK